MKLKEYIEKLQELYLEHGDLELVYASDDEVIIIIWFIMTQVL